MSDTVIIALISALSSLIAAIISLVNNNLIHKNTAHTLETKAEVAQLKVNTDGMQDQLVRVTASNSYAQGIKQGESNATEAETEARTKSVGG